MKTKKIKFILNLLIHQIKSPLVYILLFATVITFLLEEYTDFLVLSLSVIINTGLGFYQEYRAYNTVAELQKYIKVKAIVERDGKTKEIDGEDVRVGDIVILTEEYQIPADGVMIEGSLIVNEHILTGEAIPVEKGLNDEVYQGTTITSGYAKIKISKIKEETKFGEISKYVTETEQPMTPLQKQLSNLAKKISIIVSISAIIIFLFGLYENYSLYEVLTISVAVAVASVPEGLVIALTVILAVGMRNILKQKAVVKKLVAAETLGSVTTICIDKTGTITKGILNVSYAKINDQEKIKLINTFANNKLDILDKAVHSYTKDSFGGLGPKQIANYERIDYLPFNSANKFTSTIVRTPQNKLVLLTYGAAEILLNKSEIDPNDKRKWLAELEQLASNGSKVIGFGYKYIKEGNEPSDIDGIKFIGIQALSDPIRPNLKETLDTIKSAGIKLKLITGDHLVTAISVSKEAGILEDSKNIMDFCLEGSQIDDMDDQKLKDALDRIIVFARVTPKQKHRIVDLLSKKGEVVAMTGDGVNDAPALKRAAIGVVVNEASDVSKEIADIVLLDSNLKTIVHSIKEGRRIYANIKKVTLYLLSDSLTELILVISSLLLRTPLAITAGQILWVNLIEDSLPALSLAMEPAEDDLMKKKQPKKRTTILDKKMLKIMLSFVLITDILLVLTFLYLFGDGMDLEKVRTIVFVILGFDSLVYVFSCKSMEKSILQYNPFSNKYLNISVLIGFAMLLASVYLPILNSLLKTVPLEAYYWLLIFGFGVLNLVVIETMKYVFIARRNKN